MTSNCPPLSAPTQHSHNLKHDAAIDHICAELAALKARRTKALAALSNDPIQIGVSPAQDRVLRELEYVGLKMHTHAVTCDGCAPLCIHSNTGGDQ